MRFALTLGLIVAAAVALVVGFVSDNITFIYASIAFSAISPVAARFGRNRARRPVSGPPPAGEARPVVPCSIDNDPGPAPPVWDLVPAWNRRDRLMAFGAGASGVVAAAPVDPEPGSALEDFPFPIDDYDRLGAPEILPLLPELDDHELAQVLRYEEAGAGRPGIVHRIHALLDID